MAPKRRAGAAGAGADGAGKRREASAEEMLRLPAELSMEALDAHWPRMADGLLNECVLRAAGAEHRLLEVEVYCRFVGDECEWKDPFTHGAAIQRTPGVW